jgi:hypothetical protein
MANPNKGVAESNRRGVAFGGRKADKYGPFLNRCRSPARMRRDVHERVV